MSTKLKVLYTLIFLSVLIMIAIIVGMLASYNNKDLSNITPPPLPSPVISMTTPTLPPQQSIESLVNRVNNKKPLDTSDDTIRKSLITKANQNGLVIHTNDYNINYSKDANVFQIELLTQDITPAITKAISWFRDLGMSNQGMCNLPLIIYRDPKAFNPNLKAGMEFYSLPFTCQ